MRKIFAALLLTSLSLPSVYGQSGSVPSPKPRVFGESAGYRNPQNSGDTRNFFQRLFGPKPTPTPAPVAPPVVKRTKRPKPKPAVETPEEPVKKTAPKPPATDTVPQTPTTSATSAKPKTGKGVKKGTPTAAMVAGDDATKFKAAKAKALEDAHIKDLKSKADGEPNEAEAHKALLNYNRALFQKIREVDPSVSDYSGKVEQSMNRRIGSEKKE